MHQTKLQRSAWILPIARNHGVTLCGAQLGWKAVRASGTERVALMSELGILCKDEILGYLDDEQWVLSPVIGDNALREEMHQRHTLLRELIIMLHLKPELSDPGSESIVRLSRAMESLVRWEERELFPRIEDGLGPDQVKRLTRLTAKMQTRRGLPGRAARKQRPQFDIQYDLDASTLEDNLRGAGRDSRGTNKASRAAGIRDVTAGIYAFDDDFRGLGGTPRS